MGRQESPQLIERKTQVDTDAQETSRASKYFMQFSDKLVAEHNHCVTTVVIRCLRCLDNCTNSVAHSKNVLWPLVG